MDYTKFNRWDVEEDEELIAKGLPPKNYTYADHGLEEPPAGSEPAKAQRRSHSHLLSTSAHEALTEAKATIHAHRPFAKPPSSSVAIEALCWHLKHGSLNDFSPQTRNGRPQAFYGEAQIRPKHIRDQANEMLEQAGEKPIDRVTAERKLQ